ncbi:MAG: endonuclease [Ktedonobacteraceae bacterium]
MLYLLHCDEKYFHAHHYLGYTTNLGRRLDDHLLGNGARLVEVYNEHHIHWRVVRVWPKGTRTDERRLKRQKHGPRLCPVCNQKLKIPVYCTGKL